MHGVCVWDGLDADETADFAVCRVDEAFDLGEILVVDARFYDNRVFVVDKDLVGVVWIRCCDITHVAQK